MTDTLEERAAAFAGQAHAKKDQRRRFTNELYIVHPKAVAAAVSGLSEEVVAAAWLHDVVEDCGVSLEEIRVQFGERVSYLVGWCTDRFSKDAYPDMNRAQRKAAEVERLQAAPADAVAIKLADFLDNWASIKVHDVKFAKTYASEKKMVMPVYEAILRRLPNAEASQPWTLFVAVKKELEAFLR